MFQTQDDHSIGGTLSAHHAVAAHTREVANVFVILNDGLYLVEHLLRLPQVGARRTGHVHHQHTLVFLWYKSLGQSHHGEVKQYEGYSHTGPSHPTMVDDSAQETCVFAHDGTKGSLVGSTCARIESNEELVHYVARLALVLGWTHHHSTQSRTNHKGADARNTYGCGQRHTKLRVEHTRGATHHGDRNEHSHENEGT